MTPPTPDTAQPTAPGAQLDRLRADSAAVLASHARSFQLAARFLPPATRADAAVVYAFCRAADDAVDEAPDAAAARHALTTIQREVEAVATGGPHPVSPLTREAARCIAPLGFGVDPMRELLNGMESDLGDVIFADDEQLLIYCYRAAATVGLMMCGVLGIRDPAALAFAIDLGIAMQLTNICRDVLEDAARGRVYLPDARLRSAGLATGGAGLRDAILLASRRAISSNVSSSPASAAIAEAETTLASLATLRATSLLRHPVARVVKDLVALSERYYASARHGMRYIPFRSRAAILVAASVYRGINGKLAARNFDPLDGRVFTTGFDKARLTLNALFTLFAPDVLGVTRAATHDAMLHTHLRHLPGCDTATARPAKPAEPELA